MTGKKRLLLALLLGVPGLAQAQAPAPPPSAPAPAFDQVFPAIDRHFRDFQQQAHVPGMAWAIGAAAA
jgi:hypothetical protein